MRAEPASGFLGGGFFSPPSFLWSSISRQYPGKIARENAEKSQQLPTVPPLPKNKNAVPHGAEPLPNYFYGCILYPLRKSEKYPLPDL